jgi:hypothetical protein
MSWNRPFAQPVPLPEGPPAQTLRDAADFIRKLPQPERDCQEWRLAVQMLIDAAEDRGPMLFARMGIVRALEAHAERTLNPERQGQGPGQHDLKCDRDASIWIQIDITRNVAEAPEGFPSRTAANARAFKNSRALAIRSRSARHPQASRGQFVDWPKCKHAATDRLQSFLRYLPDSEVIDPLAGLQFCSKPTRRLPSSRPRLGRTIRIPKLRNDGWIWAPPCRRTRALGFSDSLELLQAIFEHALLRE